VAWKIFADETADVRIVPPVALLNSLWFLALFAAIRCQVRLRHRR